MKSKQIKMSCGSQGCNVPVHTKLTGYDKNIKQPTFKTSKIIS